MSDDNEVVETTYYPYEEVTLDNGSTFNIYTGTPVTVAADDAPPKNASKWPPHPAVGGLVSYFDGVGWTMRPDVTRMTLAQLQSVCVTKAQNDYEVAMDQIKSQYTASEQASWAYQLAGAETVLAGGTSDMIEALAEARGEDEKELAQKIVDKNTAFTKASIAALATLNKTRTQIFAATAVKDLPIITVHDLANAPI